MTHVVAIEIPCSWKIITWERTEAPIRDEEEDWTHFIRCEAIPNDYFAILRKPKRNLVRYFQEIISEISDSNLWGADDVPSIQGPGQAKNLALMAF